MLGHLALVEDNILFWIDTAGKERGGYLARGTRQFVRVLPHGDGVKIHDAIDAVIAILQRHEFGDGAEIIAEMQIASWLHAGKNKLLERHCPSSSLAWQPCHAGGAPRKAPTIFVAGRPGP